MSNKDDWFIDWFNSKYYHILYKSRNKNEANDFIKNIISNLSLNSNETVLDLGCGNGRHSISLSEHFKLVDGIDISSENITLAKKNKIENLKFFISDMRNFDTKTKYGYIFNLFTSFGYFKKNEDNINVLKKCNNHLKKDGLLFIDFLNSEKIKMTINGLKETINFDGIKFNIHKKIVDNYVVKTIEIIDGDLTFNFQEKVQLFKIEDFKEMLGISGFELLSSFGDYQMNPYDLNSNRLILCAKKLAND
jgi:cyclopropane fatty-acyl-phospholipid synthase-like methyltransferase